MARLNAAWGNFSLRGQTWDHFWQDATSSPDVTVALTGVSAAGSVGSTGVDHAQALTQAGGDGDLFYSQVKLLLHGDGANASTTFTDNSPSPLTVTATGNAQISTAQSQFGGASMAFDGTGDFLTAGANTDWTFLHQRTVWTVEGWFKFNSFAANNTLFTTCNGSSADDGIFCRVDATARTVSFFLFDANGFTPALSGTFATALPNDTNFHHVAVTCDYDDPNFIHLWIDGVASGSINGISGFSPSAATSALKIGGFSTTGDLNGYVDDFRITNGLRRYTANFTPPVAAFSNSAGAAVVGSVGFVAPAVGLTGNAGVGTIGSVASALDLSIAGNAGAGTLGSVTPVVGLTGNAGIGTVGSVAPATAVAATGNAGSGVVGSVTPTVGLTGNAGTGTVGSVAPAITVATSGNAGVGVVGSVAPTITLAITGNAGTGVVGSVAPAVAVTGNAGAGAVGSVKPALALAPSGVAGSGVVGSVAPTISVAITGVAGSGVVGSVTPTRALTGVAAADAVGTLGVATALALTGVAGAGVVGSVTTGSDKTLPLTGTASAGVVGSVAPAIALAATGLAAAAAAGSLGVGAAFATSGVSAAGTTGALVGGTSLALAGALAAGASGFVGITSTLGLAGIAAIGAVGSVGAPALVAEAEVDRTFVSVAIQRVLITRTGSPHVLAQTRLAPPALVGPGHEAPRLLGPAPGATHTFLTARRNVHLFSAP